MNKFNVGDQVICKSSHFAFAIDMATGSVSVNDFLDIELNSEGIYKGVIQRPEDINPSGEMAQQFNAIAKPEYEVVEVSGRTYVTDMVRWDTFTESKIADDEYEKMMEDILKSTPKSITKKQSMNTQTVTKEKEIVKEVTKPTMYDEFKKKYELLKRYLGMMGVNENDAKEAVVKEEVTKITAKYLEMDNHNDCAECVKLVFNIIDNIDEFIKDIENLN